MIFTKSKHCLSKYLCKECREDQSFRKELVKVFELPDDNLNFKCPYGQTDIDTEFIKVDYEFSIKIFDSSAVPNRPPKPCTSCRKV